MSPLERISWV